MAMTYDQYQNKRSWLIDTAETAADQKRLKAQLAKLDAMYKAQKAAAKATPKPATKTVPVKKKATTEQKIKAAKETKTYRDNAIASGKLAYPVMIGGKAVAAKDLRKKLDADKTAMRAKNVASKLAKAPVKKTTAMGQSAKSHQKDLAKISGEVASAKEYNRQVSKATKLMKTGKDASLAYSGNKRLAVGAKAVKKTTASFKKSK